MTDHTDLATRIGEALSLETVPVAITFTDTAPVGVAAPAGAVPAGCSFWEIGMTRTVLTEGKHHEHCSIGVHTHRPAGVSGSQPRELEVALGAMRGLDYVRPGEVEALPVMAAESTYVVYGPLADAAEPPDAVLIFARAAQGLVLTEALARVDGGSPVVMGRPACALVPQVVNSGRAAASLGCCGARAYLDVLGDDIALWGLPGHKLEAYAAEIETLARANTVLTQFHRGRRSDIEAGRRPTVEASLAKLG